MFGKLGKRYAGHLGHFSKVKGFAMGAYRTGRQIAAAIDAGADIVSRTHQALSPLLQETDVGRKASIAVTSGMEGYDHAKSNVLNKHRKVEEAAGRVRQFAPELSALF